MNKEIEKIIDDTIKSIWMKDIKADYDGGWLLREDTLKNAFYHHLRTKLGQIFELKGIRVYSEYTGEVFAGSGFRPDIVIAEIKSNGEKNLICVIEIKYKNGFYPHKDILKDYEKLKYYVEEMGVSCKLYMATIWEYEDDQTSWERKNAYWANGQLTELNASYSRKSKDMTFYVCKH